MPNTIKLCFPPILARIKEEQGEKYIWDSLRQKWLLLTPEEWVRRNAIEWLVKHRGIPALRISQEYPVNINGQHQRADIVVVDERAQPYLLVECKAHDIALDNEVVMQAMRYNAIVGARFVILTNGRKIFCYEHCDGQYRPAATF